MELNMNIEHINDTKIIPSAILTFLFMFFSFLLFSELKIPLEAEKPPEEMVLKFVKDIKPQLKKKPKDKKKPKTKPDEVVVDDNLPVVDQIDPIADPVDMPTFEDVAAVDISVDIADELTKEIENMPTTIAGADGVTDLLSDLNNPQSTLASGADMGIDAHAGFDGVGAVTNIPSNNTGLTGIHRKQRRARVGTQNTGFPEIEMEVPDFISPIIEWMKRNRVALPEMLKPTMGYARGNLTSRVNFRIKGTNESYVIFLLCKQNQTPPLLVVCFANFTDKKFILFKDAGMMGEAGYVMQGICSGSPPDNFSFIDTEQIEASEASTQRYLSIFMSWFNNKVKR